MTVKIHYSLFMLLFSNFYKAHQLRVTAPQHILIHVQLQSNQWHRSTRTSDSHHPTPMETVWAVTAVVKHALDQD